MTSILTSARQAWLRDQFDDALDLFREARSLAPQDVRLAIEVASYLAMRFEVSEAVKILNQCEQRVVGHGAALHQLGIAYRRAHRDQEAFRCYEAAVKLDYQPAKYDSIEWHERRGELAEATSIVKHCP